MSNVQELEMAVSQLTANELMQFSEWFEEFMADQWEKNCGRYFGWSFGCRRQVC